MHHVSFIYIVKLGFIHQFPAAPSGEAETFSSQIRNIISQRVLGFPWAPLSVGQASRRILILMLNHLNWLQST